MKKDGTNRTDGTDGTNEEIDGDGYVYEDFEKMRRVVDIAGIVEVLINTDLLNPPDNWNIYYNDEGSWLIACKPKGE